MFEYMLSEINALLVKALINMDLEYSFIPFFIHLFHFLFIYSIFYSFIPFIPFSLEWRLEGFIASSSRFGFSAGIYLSKQPNTEINIFQE